MKTTDPQNELLCVVDDEDNIVGKATRKECHSKKLRHRTAGAFVFNKNWELFITQRSDTKDMEPSLWSLSCGGHVEHGDSYEETARKELEEELEIEGKPIFIKKFLNNLEDELEMSAQYYVVTDQIPRVNEEEIKQGKFVSFEELEKITRKDKFSEDIKYQYPILVKLLKDKSIIPDSI
ncbi:MAG: NUDIX domain-containing protein [Candidatus Aenigmarchaeota archaeon]|nr:NUDIX domain-containing protein [Candidatus Aenigmarchaeota archaeon]